MISVNNFDIINSMELDFINKVDKKFDKYEEIYIALMDKVFKTLSLKGNYYVEVNLVDNATIHKINREYRHIDRPTDVISFAFHDEVENEVTIKGDFPDCLGTIIISTEKALAQAAEYNHEPGYEMRFLFVHGILHLLGYDHVHNKEEEKIMFDLQDKILEGENYD